jgi:hypothetical protein
MPLPLGEMVGALSRWSLFIKGHFGTLNLCVLILYIVIYICIYMQLVFYRVVYNFRGYRPLPNKST